MVFCVYYGFSADYNGRLKARLISMSEIELYQFLELALIDN